jgi:hypothetical protein
MQGTLSTLLLISACVMITCVVVDYAATVVQSTTQTNTPSLNRLKQMEQALLNQTDALWTQTNQTLSEPDSSLLTEP